MKLSSSLIVEHQSAGRQSISGIAENAPSMIAPGACTTCAASCCCSSCCAAVDIQAAGCNA